MFVAEHAGRRRLVRLAFVFACLIPCLLVAVWAGWRHSPWHRASLRRAFAATTGLRLAIGGVEHVRPGTMRLHRVAIRGDGTEVLLDVPSLELDLTAAEVRLRIAAVRLAPAAVEVLAGLGREWLAQAGRFDRNVVVDVGEVRFATAGPGGGESAAAADGWHLECVAVSGGRAIRLRTEPESADSFVLRRLDGTEVSPPLTEVRAVTTRPLPLAIAAAAMEWPALVRVCGVAATVTGSLEARLGADGWGGTFDGRIAPLDLAAATANLAIPIDVGAELTLAGVRFAAGRLVRGQATLVGGSGTIPQGSLERFVSVLGCRPGPAWRPVDPATRLRFDRIGAAVTLDAAGARLEPIGGAGLVDIAGASLLAAPTGPVAIDRVVRTLSPTIPGAVPPTEVSGRLLGLLPLPSSARAIEGDVRDRPAAPGASSDSSPAAPSGQPAIGAPAAPQRR